MVLEYAMAVLGAKKVFGLVSAGTSTVRKVGFFVCFDVPKKTLRFCIRTQKEILLFPFRCAGVTFKAVRNYFRPNQPTKRSTIVSERCESEGRLQTSGSADRNPQSSGSADVSTQSLSASVFNSENESISPISGSAKECIPSSDSSASNNSNNKNTDKEHLSNKISSPSTKLDVLTILTNGNMDAKEVAKQTKTLLTTSLQSVRRLEKWRLEKKKRLSNKYELSSLKSDDDMFQSSEMEKELYHGLCATWNYCRALKAKKEEISADFNNKARKFFSKSIPKMKKFDESIRGSLPDINCHLRSILEKCDVDTSAFIFEHGLQMCCNGNEKFSTDYEELKSAVKRMADENSILYARVNYMNGKLEEVFKSSNNLRAEVANLTNQFHNMTIMGEKLKELQAHLADTRELLFRSELDRDNMVGKLQALAKLIKEEEDFLDNSPYAKRTTLRSSPTMQSNKKIN